MLEQENVSSLDSKQVSTVVPDVPAPLPPHAISNELKAKTEIDLNVISHLLKTQKAARQNRAACETKLFYQLATLVVEKP